MNYEKYIEKMLVQYRGAAEVYEKQIFVPVERMDRVMGLRTKEHFRLPPTDGLVPVCKGEKWGGMWQNLWLMFELKLDERFVGKQVWLIPETGATEILCFRNGVPHGIINSKNEYIGMRHSAFFAVDCKEPQKMQIAMECYAGHFCPGAFPYERYGNDEGREEDYVKSFDGVQVCVMDEAVKNLVFDLTTVLELTELPENNFMRGRAIRALTEAFPYLIQAPLQYSREEIDAAAVKVSELLAPALEKQAVPDAVSHGCVSVTGHSHMDTAWVWPYSETIRKCARTYSEALDLMERYPEYSFIQSSALHIAWMERYYPDVYEGIRRRVAEGRYEPNGGVWVECDCNITGAESMARQFFYGQRYTREKFGYTSDCFWLPDTFGYSAAIPQIMQQSDVKYFLTTKISWNDMNIMGSDTFRWRGLGGSEVLTHFNVMQASTEPRDVVQAVEGILDKSSADSRLLAYGWGDGGGGPTYGMLEFLKRTKDLPGLPKVTVETVSSFMEGLDKRRAQFPVYDGELYLEFHRGTLTTIHDIKRNNRKAEGALHNLEFINAASGQKQNPQIEYLYKELLRNQFHDILPGSSIAEVNDTAREEVAAVIAGAQREMERYLGEASDRAVTLVNTTSFDWKPEDVFAAEGSVSLSGARCQPYTDVMGRSRTAVMGLSVPAYGSAVYALSEANEMADVPFSLDGDRLSTPLYEVRFDECGYISLLIDRKTGREFVRPGAEPLGTLWMGENVPDQYENWEIAPSMELKLKPVRKLLSRETVSAGSVELRIRSVYAVGQKSNVTVDTVFGAACREIRFEMRVDWHDKHHLLKIGFDVDVQASLVKNEIQFGYMERPTTRNTTLDTAKFEVVNHKWSDISDSRGGVALINDCKYGMSAKGSEMRLTLMHGGCRPDPRGDEGVHEMSCAIVPHDGPFNAQNTIAPAYKMNLPLLMSRTECTLPQMFELSSDHVVCETVKCAEDVENAYVLRLYECEGVAADCHVTLNHAKRVSRVNLLEEEQETLALRDGGVTLRMRPFEIVSLLVYR